MASTAELTLDVPSILTGPELLTPETRDAGPSSELLDTTDIAPWLNDTFDEPPTPPPKPISRTFGFPHKASLASFTSRHGSASSSMLFRERFSEAATADYRQSNGSSGSLDPEYDARAGRSLRKQKSSLGFLSALKRQRSKPRSNGTGGDSPPTPVPPIPSMPSPDRASFHPHGSPPSPPPSLKKSVGKKKQKKSTQRPRTPRASGEPELKLDMNLDDMSGVVDMSATQMDMSSAGSMLESSRTSHDSGRDLSDFPSPQTTTIFNNPFAPSFSSHRHAPANSFDRKVSPKTYLPTDQLLLPLVPRGNGIVNGDSIARPPSPSWEAPESWAVDKKGQDDADELVYSSEEEYADAEKRKSRRQTVRQSKQLPPPTSPPVSEDQTKKQDGQYKLRIYRANNTYHLVSIPPWMTVGGLIGNLLLKLPMGPDRDSHRLYIKERGRERVLAATERPADMVRRRLTQAGYDRADHLESLGQEDIGFLMKFVFKSTVLGPAEVEIILESFETVDLTGRALKTVPVVLYAHADEIVTLNLSRNPMVEIPLDFIQLCIELRELRLSSMAMKKVPHSVRHCVKLNRLDLTSNRIADLEEAELHRLPDLKWLKLQNNRMERLPWGFPRLRVLQGLNISNNKFRHLPAVVSEMTSLIELDISFNMIDELPDEIGQLVNLQRFVIVGNRIRKFPEQCKNLGSLSVLDCRRNAITDLSIVCLLPRLQTLRADNNAVHALELALGPELEHLEAPHNDITQLTLMPGPLGSPYALTTLDISYAQLSKLDELALANLSSLHTLKLDHNAFKLLPESLGELSRLSFLSCSHNQLETLPSTIGQLQKLEHLDVHSNSLMELPAEVWNCASLIHLNATSNLLATWHYSSLAASSSMLTVPDAGVRGGHPDRKPSAADSVMSVTGATAKTRAVPPLAHSLERLYLGENQLTDELLRPLMILKELKVLNLSFNRIQEMPSTFFHRLTKLEEVYLSGNKLSSLPTEDLHRLTKLHTLFLNGNKFQSLPQELNKITSLANLDVGSNVLKYNIHNWEFDWNWNFNTNLRYLNLSGNNRLEIKPDNNREHSPREQNNRKVLADFSALSQLRVLGLMDVTTTFMPNIPDEHEDRRVRTSLSKVNRMAYGIADTIGKSDQLTMVDLVKPEFREQRNEAIFAMFGRAQSIHSNNRLSKYLSDNFATVFAQQLSVLNSAQGEGVEHAMRRTFLKLNKYLHDYLVQSTRKSSQASISTSATASTDYANVRAGASGIALYFVDKVMHVGNAGNALAVVSHRGNARPVSRKHDPFDRDETTRIRAAEGWVSPKGLVNDEIDVSRSFGFYHLLPIVNPRPDVCTYELSPLDEFVIVGNRGLWDYVSYQTAVDIARSERADPTIAAQKLRDFAISYGSEGSTMIMVISVAGLFDSESNARARQATLESVDITDDDPFPDHPRDIDDIRDTNIKRLAREVPPPRDHVCLVFTDIRNSTHLWEANPGMRTAMRLHNNLLRRQLRFCGGYEVKTEGDAFMCAFHNALSALWWALSVQTELLTQLWPLEILECEDGKEIFDSSGNLIARGLSVRMGIHCGNPECERDPVTHRMDYFGPMVNRSARIMGSAGGGDIMVSADIIREVKAMIYRTGPETENSHLQPEQAIEGIHQIGMTILDKGEHKLKGLEVPEHLSLIYPTALAGREGLEQAPEDPNASGSRVQFSVSQMRELARLCVRLEILTTSRVLRPRRERRGSFSDALPDESAFMECDIDLLLPTISEKATDADLSILLDTLSIRIENALASLTLKHVMAKIDGKALCSAFGDDARTLQILRNLL